MELIDIVGGFITGTAGTAIVSYLLNRKKNKVDVIKSIQIVYDDLIKDIDDRMKAQESFYLKQIDDLKKQIVQLENKLEKYESQN